MNRWLERFLFRATYQNVKDARVEMRALAAQYRGEKSGPERESAGRPACGYHCGQTSYPDVCPHCGRYTGP
jgi:rubrerythrin